jgi:hypothetical protein
MISKGPAVPTAAATAILGLVIGGVAGFYIKAANENPNASKSPYGAQGAPGGGGGGGMGAMGGGGGGGGRGGGGGGGQQASPSRDLTGLVRNLGTVEKVQNKGLTAEQKKSLAPILKKIQAADKLSDDDCKADIASIDGILTADQKDNLKALTPQRGGGGRGGGGGGGRGGAGGGMMAGGAPGRSAGGMGGAPTRAPMMAAAGGGGAPTMGGGGMGGGQPDPTKPFANERNKQALDDLISAVGK